MGYADELCQAADNAKIANIGILKAGLSAGTVQGTPQIRTFETGATRDQDQDKLDYAGFLSPLVIERYAQYMHEHRKQSDGTLRASDNWQKGMPRIEYVRSMWRHFMDVWKAAWSGYYSQKQMQDALCGVMFNAMGLMHEILINRNV